MKTSFIVMAAAGAGILAVSLIGYGFSPAPVSGISFNEMSPAAGPETPVVPPAPTLKTTPVEATPQETLPSANALGLNTAVRAESADAAEIPPLRIAPDQPAVIQLDRDAINILVGSNKNLRVVPDTNRTLVLIPKQPGSTYFRALDSEGKVIMQRHVIIGAPKNDYIRIRRACVNSGDRGCREYSVYYCPDMCHEVSVTQGETAGRSPQVPTDAPLYRPRPVAENHNDGVEPSPEANIDTSGTPPQDGLEQAE